ncbi:hypothetical protein CPB84DRAFT_1744176 [Gymnopilus junonius]|uniref:Uncharacterized protein n=1 Tax=Gymnopilus junonius TaxID=109634 RepID=A0A9P5TRE1_GYMJU|nr:hypothetical protein CPB84DRAFT_1744176 [Gymnopilus junonius]
MLGHTTGNIEIKDGQFTATAGHQFNITINASALDNMDDNPPKPQSLKSKSPKRKALRRAHDENLPRAEGPHSKSKVAISKIGILTNDQESHTEVVVTHGQTSYDIYYRLLASKGRGSPLWIPQPNKSLPIDYQRTGMRIGDVGIITSRGSFMFLFNICYPADHPINRNKVPENFVPLTVDSANDIQMLSEFGPESYLSSASIKKLSRAESSSLVFESSASEGAILTMPVGSNSQDLMPILRFKKYVAQHAEDWYKHIINVRECEVNNGDVRLVIGHDKTSSWGMATFSSSTAEDSALYLSFRPTDPGTILDRQYGWDLSGSAEVRNGPDPREVEVLRKDDPAAEEGAIYQNQCLFVRTINPKLQDGVWKNLVSGFGQLGIQTEERGDNDSDVSGHSRQSHSQNSSRSGSNRSQGTVLGQVLQNMSRSGQTSTVRWDPPSSRAVTNHPSEILNNMLLSFDPHARIAITEDADWISILLPEDAILPSKEEIYGRVMSSFCMHEEGKKRDVQQILPLTCGLFDTFSQPPKTQETIVDINDACEPQPNAVGGVIELHPAGWEPSDTYWEPDTVTSGPWADLKLSKAPQAVVDGAADKVHTRSPGEHHTKKRISTPKRKVQARERSHSPSNPDLGHDMAV